jgi:predicted lipid-binding transport protein (Tim44 family)
MPDQSQETAEPAPPSDLAEGQLHRSLTDPLGMHQLAEAENFADKAREYLDAEHEKMIEEVGADLTEHGDLVAPGVDLAPLKQADSSFDPANFIDVARECYNHIREARSTGNPVTAAGTMSNQLKAALEAAIASDAAAHRHHLLAGLEIASAVITGATVGDGKLNIVVRFHLEGEEMDRDDHLNVVAGSQDEQTWDEEWTFWRDPSVDTSATDEDHILTRERDGGWLFAHRGWLVTTITRLGAPDPLDPTAI